MSNTNNKSKPDNQLITADERDRIVAELKRRAFAGDAAAAAVLLLGSKKPRLMSYRTAPEFIS